MSDTDVTTRSEIEQEIIPEAIPASLLPAGGTGPTATEAATLLDRTSAGIPDEPLQLTMEGRSWHLRLKLLAPLSHHDPDQQDKSNVSLFRRQAQLVERTSLGRLPTQADIDGLSNSLPVPVGIADIFQDLTLEEFVGAALFKVFVARYGRGDGTGLFSGMERYRRLEERFRQAAEGTENALLHQGAL